MTNSSTPLLLRRVFPHHSDETIRCIRLLRSVPGRREVFDARWNDRPVVVKIFFHPCQARRHLQREWRGLKAVAARGLTSQKPLFYGRADAGRWALVVEKIVDSRPAADVFAALPEGPERVELLKNVCRELAAYHDRGVLQRDMHLGNFLLRGDRAFMLDSAQMTFRSRPVTRKEGISQVALLGGILQDDDEDSLRSLCRAYLEARGYRPSDADEAAMLSLHGRYRKTAVLRGLKKTLRTSKRYQRVEGQAYRAVYERAFFEDADLRPWLERLTVPAGAGESATLGKSPSVSTLEWNAKKVVVRRYRERGRIRAILPTFETSRAKRAWVNGHLLRMLGIGTPRPICCVEFYRGCFVRESLLILECIEGETLAETLQEPDLPPLRREALLQQVRQRVRRLHEHRIAHGDLKQDHILVSAQGPVLTDLDRMKVCAWDFLFKIRRDRDLRRLNLDGPRQEPARG
ncbi:MAG TPA: lipopolysaccharide kinase InaA family protein [Syntrophales bacterium]|nr:lipopolysaccharide kinase InaA family protein [Syntrophales bacterium]